MTLYEINTHQDQVSVHQKKNRKKNELLRFFCNVECSGPACAYFGLISTLSLSAASRITNEKKQTKDIRREQIPTFQVSTKWQVLLY